LKKSNVKRKSLKRNDKSKRSLKQRSVPGSRKLKRKTDGSKRQRKSVSRSVCKKFKRRSESKLRKKTKECSASLSEKRLKSAFFNSNSKFKRTEKC
jgi:hypothetical protein